MSKTHPPSYIKILLLLVALQIFTEARGQDLAVEIHLDSASGKAEISAKYQDGFRPESGRSFLFRRSVARNPRSAERITEFRALSLSGAVVESERRSPNELVASSLEIGEVRYLVDLRPSSAAAKAHASWLEVDGGALMLDDLLPVFGGDRKRLRAAVSLKLPEGWRSYSSNDAGNNDSYDVSNVEGSVIFVGPRFREVRVPAKHGALSLIIDGDWLFLDGEATQMAAEVYDFYVKMLGPLPTRRSLITLTKLSRAEPPGKWEAETRGATVTIASSDMAFKTQSQQRLHEQLRHEIFHLWFPNAVELSGDYAWFYEGFALYHSLKLGVTVKRIRFADMLDTLSRAYSIDANANSRRPIDRSSGADATILYARGMVIAFLADIAAIRSSGGKRDSGAALRELFARHRSPAASIQATDAVRNVVSEELIRRYVSGTEPIDWSSELGAAGLEIKSNGRNFELQSVPKPNGRQKEILKRLGYN
jgi:predicted metalloprotease with PDZ domain